MLKSIDYEYEYECENVDMSARRVTCNCSHCLVEWGKMPENYASFLGSVQTQSMAVTVAVAVVDSVAFRPLPMLGNC